MKISRLTVFLVPVLFAVGCARPTYYTKTTAYQEPATAPLIPTGHREERVYSDTTPATPAREAQSPAVIVEPSGAQTTQADLAIGDAIRRAFEADRDLSPALRQMIISVHGGTVRLMGPVANKVDEQAVLDRLRTIPGVTAIRDELEIRPEMQ